MKFIKSKLLQIPLETFPACAVKANMQLIATANVHNVGTEKLLVTTLYRTDNRASYLRIFCDKDGKSINYDYEAKSWNHKSQYYLKMPDSYSSLCYSSQIQYLNQLDDAEGVRFFRSKEKRTTLEAVYDAQNKRESKARAVAGTKTKNLIARILSEQPPMPEDAVQQALDGPMKYYRYLFFQTKITKNVISGEKEKINFGYCTHCHKEYELLYEPTHKSKDICPGCHSKVTALATRYGHSRLMHYGKYRIFTKTSEGAVFVRLFTLLLDYRGDFKNVQLEYSDDAFYYFNRGEAYEFKASYGWSTNNATEWHKTNRVFDISGYEDTYPIPAGFFNDTCLCHSHLDDYLSSGVYARPMQYIAAFVKNPNIEHLVGCGLLHVVQDKVIGNAFTNRIVSWDKRRPRDMLGVSQPEIELFVKKNWDSETIYGYKCCKQAGFIPEEVDIDIINCFAAYNKILYFEKFKPHTARIILTFLRRQAKKKKCRSVSSSIFGDWRDYLKECRTLVYNLDDPKIYYPPDLHKAHQKTTELMHQKRAEEARLKSEAEQKKFSKRLIELEGLTYVSEDAGLLIRAAQSRQELVDEGASLHHCVGGYTDQHLSGKTTILFIRRIDFPNMPYFTLEFKDGKINQNRGKGNCSPPDDVKRFVEKWLHEVALVKPKKEKKAKQNKQECTAIVAVA